MPITIDDLTVNFDHINGETFLSGWRWLIGNNKQAILLTAVGDTFLQDTEDGTIHFLDTVVGKLQYVAESTEDFGELLESSNFVVNYFGVELFSDLQKTGKKLNEGQIFSYKQPPILGGEATLDNIEATDIEVHFSLMGQIHDQVKELPEGTPISQVKIAK